jgi:hypothetical protein
LRAARRRAPCHQPVDALEVLERRELDDHLAPRRAHRDPHAGLEMVAEQFLQLDQARRAKAPTPRPGVAGRGWRLTMLRLVLPDRLLDRPHREVLVDNPVRERFLEGPVGGGEQGASVAHGQAALVHEPLDRRWQLQQAQRVRDRYPAAPDLCCHGVVGEPEVLDELLVGGGLLERVEVVPVQVLDERVFQRGGVVGLAHQRRNGLEPHPPGGAPPPLPRDDLVPVVDGTNENRLQHADLADRVGERPERLLVEVVPRLEAVGADRRRGERLETPRLRLERRPRGDECAESLTQTAASRHRSPLSPAPGTPSRRETSGRTR